MPSQKRVLSIGNCATDHGNLCAALEKHFTVEVVSADNAVEAMAQLHSATFDLVLVNRLFDLDGDSGIAFIKKVKADSTFGRTPMMLLSNYPESQDEAMEAGALPGFGKKVVGKQAMVDALRVLQERDLSTSQ